jgi:hypothetical protein
MKPVVRSLAAAAALAAATPLAARADRCDEARPGGPPPAWTEPDRAPAAWPQPGDRGEYRPVRDGWRARELARVQGEIAALDAERARFHARWAFHPGKLRRFDRRWFFERSELERRYRELAYYAWR